MALLAAPLLLLRRVVFAAPRALRLPRLLVLAALRVFDAARLRDAFGRPVFETAAVLARALVALGRPAAAFGRPAFGRPALLRRPFAFERAERALALRTAVLRADARRGLRPRPAPVRLGTVPSTLSPAMGGEPI